jgi:molybdopterin synthase catalytic subunit
VVFEGRVRDHNDGKGVVALEYEAFAELALPIGAQILEEAAERFAIESADCVHRIGSLQVGDLAVRVTVSASHRQGAFDACAWIIDEVKKRVPIWKKEFYVNGEVLWLDPTSPARAPQEPGEAGQKSNI